MNDSISLLTIFNSKLDDSLVQLSCMPNCRGVDASKALYIQQGCFDKASFGVAVVACFIAIITCFYTIRMYWYVKKQLNTAKEQLEKQKTDNEKNEKYRKRLMGDTKTHVDQIKNQILIDSLVSLLEKKHKFIYHFDGLLRQLYNHVSYLDIDRERHIKAHEKEKKYYTVVKNCVSDVEYHLGYMKDIIGIIDKKEKETIEKINVIMDKLIVIKKKAGVAKGNRDVYCWVKKLEQNKDELLTAIDNSYKNINNKIQS